MFYQTYAARKPPKVPVTVHFRHRVTPGGHGMAPSDVARHLQCTAQTLQCIVNGMTQQFSRFCPWSW